eukprot:scaffold4061_cov108-Cylindrotheca_fusiformis.AAC.18
MEEDNPFSLLGAMDPSPRYFLDNNNHVNRDSHLDLNHNLAIDFEPTPINEGLSGSIQQVRLNPSAFRTGSPQDPMDEMALLRDVLNQATDVLGVQDDMIRSLPFPCSQQERRLPSSSTVECTATAGTKHRSQGEELKTKPEFADVSNAQSGRWYERYKDLVKFKAEFGHCCVPSHWPRNPPLAQWVKRQRHQYKRANEGLHSNISPARIEALNKMMFVWDPHSAFWEERLNELYSFRRKYGHCNVPTKFPENPHLAIWVKCQRRQFKLFCTDGPKRSNMTLERITKLTRAGFVFDPRQARKRR